MKFESYLNSIAGISIYPMISLIIFFVFFSLLGIWVVKIKKEEISILENLPLSETANPFEKDNELLNN